MPQNDHAELLLHALSSQVGQLCTNGLGLISARYNNLEQRLYEARSVGKNEADKQHIAKESAEIIAIAQDIIAPGLPPLLEECDKWHEDMITLRQKIQRSVHPGDGQVPISPAIEDWQLQLQNLNARIPQIENDMEIYRKAARNRLAKSPLSDDSEAFVKQEKASNVVRDFLSVMAQKMEDTACAATSAQNVAAQAGAVSKRDTGVSA